MSGDKELDKKIASMNTEEMREYLRSTSADNREYILNNEGYQKKFGVSKKSVEQTADGFISKARSGPEQKSTSLRDSAYVKDEYIPNSRVQINPDIGNEEVVTRTNGKIKGMKYSEYTTTPRKFKVEGGNIARNEEKE